jgi:pimeloyl-ACP methyl ester carboxylesterase
MPYATNPSDGVGIYYEVTGEGPPVVLQHGGGSSLQRWVDYRYVNHLSQHYKLILFDARGHRQRDQPHDAAAYRYERWVRDVVTLLDHLAVDRAHFLGYSLGALAGFRILQYAPGRVRSLVRGGAYPGILYDHFNRQYELYKDGFEGLLEMRRQAANPVGDEER